MLMIDVKSINTAIFTPLFLAVGLAGASANDPAVNVRIKLDSGNCVLNWQANDQASGYKIWFSENLIDGFQLIDELADGSADSWQQQLDLACGFYKVEQLVDEVTTDPTTGFAAGSGTSDDPYQIAAAVHLQKLFSDSSLWGDSFKLTRNVSMAGVEVNAGVGNYDEPFSGEFDGNGFTISGLAINQPEASGVAMFSELRDASISNVVMDEVNIVGWADVSALAAYAEDSVIENCHVLGGSVTGVNAVGGVVGTLYYAEIRSSSSAANITATQTGIGGLVGAMYGSTGLVEDCWASGNVSSSNSYVGGLVGDASNEAVIRNSYATGKVTGWEFVGGLVGLAQRKCVIEYCYSSSDVSSVMLAGKTSATRAGGLLGEAENSTVQYCYAAGNVTGYEMVGGLLGSCYNTAITECHSLAFVTAETSVGGLLGVHASGNLKRNYWSIDGSGQQSSAGSVTGLTAAEMAEQSSFVSWNASVWDFSGDYPVLIAQ